MKILGTFCKNVYCDRYWGCSSPFGQGQLKELKDFQIVFFFFKYLS